MSGSRRQDKGEKFRVRSSRSKKPGSPPSRGRAGAPFGDFLTGSQAGAGVFAIMLQHLQQAHEMRHQRRIGGGAPGSPPPGPPPTPPTVARPPPPGSLPPPSHTERHHP